MSSQQQEQTKEAWTGITKSIRSKMLELDTLRHDIEDMKTVLDKELAGLQREVETAKGAIDFTHQGISVINNRVTGHL